ncbi:LysM peptidoglycan-binding domain-containing protein, partial [Candidatus Saccharibacteria bacterium]|nr:LysM peptidoglycan-binding domain-containing protein [Candidatus Saccharibacteria bacterium]
MQICMGSFGESRRVQMILAPFATGLAIAGSLALPAGQPAVAQTHTNDNNTKSNKTVQIKQASEEKVYVMVNEGDTLDGIATAHQTTYNRLYDANTDIQDPNVIYPGEKVRIPEASEQIAPRALPVAPAPVAPTVSQAPVSQSAPVHHSTVSLPTSGGAVAGCGDNSYANFIYSHESGCRTTAMSPNGCYGIGQACPASKIAHCGADYACQNAFFTAYAGKYGGWAGAYSFWVA